MHIYMRVGWCWGRGAFILEYAHCSTYYISITLINTEPNARSKLDNLYTDNFNKIISHLNIFSIKTYLT